MGPLRERSRHDTLPVGIAVYGREDAQKRGAWKIATVDVTCMTRLTPMEMREMGRWLVAEGKRLGREYTSTGESKKSKLVNGPGIHAMANNNSLLPARSPNFSIDTTPSSFNTIRGRA